MSAHRWPRARIRMLYLWHLCRGETVDGSVIHSLESAVIEWSHQIRAVLKKDSSEALLEGKSPTPQTELLFWNNRSGPVLLQTPRVRWRPQSSTFFSDYMEIKCTLRGPPKLNLLFAKFLLPLIILVSEGTPVLSCEKCDLEPTASFLFCFFLLSATHTAELHLLRYPVSTTFIIYYLCTHVTEACLFSICFALCTLCRYEVYPLLLHKPLISLTLACRQYILIMH